MPIYEHECRSCGHISEVLVQGFFNSQTRNCPDCGQKMERRVTSPSLVLEKVNQSGKTCCGREERCEKPSCSSGEHCSRH